MEATELLKKVRRIEIKTRGLSRHIFAGEYHSAFKGRGIAFSEVREYQYGDDIRSIDWNVTARFNHPFIKIFEEERELTVMLVVDASASGQFGTVSRFKREIAAELAAVLAFSAITNNDKVGLLVFTDQVELFIPPRKVRRVPFRPTVGWVESLDAEQNLHGDLRSSWCLIRQAFLSTFRARIPASRSSRGIPR